jgi:hypothetical protein
VKQLEKGNLRKGLPLRIVSNYKLVVLGMLDVEGLCLLYSSFVQTVLFWFSRFPVPVTGRSAAGLRRAFGGIS